MLGLGMPEILFILVLALLIFGPKKLPEIGRTLGRGLGEFRRATSDLKRTFDTDMQALDREVKPPPPKIEPPAETVRRVDTASAAGSESPDEELTDDTTAPSASPEDETPPA